LNTLKTTIKERKLMARITVEDCLEKVNNRFSIIHMAAKRVRQLDRGSVRLVECKNQNGVTALREIAAGRVSVKDEKAKKK
jgi:DNA-directed RNA polymerase subunit omega